MIQSLHLSYLFSLALAFLDKKCKKVLLYLVRAEQGGQEMKVLLLQDVKGHGKVGDLIDVNDGFARNYIIPKKLGVEANKKMLNEYAQKKQKEERLRAEARQQALDDAKALRAASIDVPV